MASQTMRAVVVQADRTVKVETKPVPTLSGNEILLKTRVLGQNPTDWKHAAFTSKPGTIIGCDAVGEVVEIGKYVPEGAVKLGELRSVFQRGGFSNERGGFAEYIASDWELTSLVPENISAEQAATTPIPFLTAVLAFYYALKLPEPIQPQSTAESPWILVWSGATAVGQYAIQLAKLSGLNVVTTASIKNVDELKALGANEVIDYKDPEVVSKLKGVTGDRISFALDCFSEGNSSSISQLAIQPSGGKLVTLLFDHTGLPRKDVETQAVLAYNSLGHDMAMGGDVVYRANPEHRAFHVKYQKILPQLLRDGHIKPLKFQLEGGLDDVQRGFELMRDGKHEHKIVYRL